MLHATGSHTFQSRGSSQSPPSPNDKADLAHLQGYTNALSAVLELSGTMCTRGRGWETQEGRDLDLSFACRPVSGWPHVTK